MELDEKVALPGAEGIDLDLVLAGIGSRGTALMIDLAIQGAAFVLLALAASPFETVGVAILAVGSFLVLFGYPIAMEAFSGGQTVGKRALGIAVVRPDGTPIGFLAATIRCVVRVIDALPGVFTVGLVAMLATDRNQRLGDLAAGTLVVRRGKEQQVVGGSAAYAAYGGPLVAAELPPEVAAWDLSAVTAEEVAAIRSFLGRRHELEPVHRQRLAEVLAGQVVPKVAGVPLDGGPELLLERIAWAKHHRR